MPPTPVIASVEQPTAGDHPLDGATSPIGPWGERGCAHHSHPGDRGGNTTGVSHALPPEARRRRRAGARFTVRLGIITAVGLAWRIWFIQMEAPIRFLTDEFWFDTEARRLFTAARFTDPVFGYPTAIHAPLGAVAFAPLVWIWPHGDDHLRLFSAVVGAATVVAFGVVGRKFAGDRVGLLAASLAVVTPDLWMSSGLVTGDALTALLTVCVLGVTYEALHSLTWPRGVLLGVLLGLLVLSSSESLALAVLIPAGLALRQWRRHPVRQWPKRTVPVLVAVVMVAVVLTPWLAYNGSRFDGQVILTTNLGQTLISSNNPSTYFPGTDFGYQDILPPAVHATPVQRRDEPYMDDLQRRDAVDYARAHVSRLAVVLPLRVLWLWSLRHPAVVAERESLMGYPSWTGSVQAVGTWILLALGIAGLWVLRRRHQVIWPLVTMLVLATANGLVFTPSFRYRLDGIVALVMGSAATLDWGWGRLRSGGGRPSPPPREGTERTEAGPA